MSSNETKPPASTNNCCGDDSHAHTQYSGADIVKQLGTGYALATLGIPAVIIVAFITLSAFVPGDFAPFSFGVGLGLLQYLASSIFSFAATRRSLAGHRPSLAFNLANSVIQEVLRVAVIALFASAFAGWLTANSIWLAFGAATGQLLALTASEATSRKAMQKPGAWSQNQVEYVLTLGVSGHSVTIRRLLEHLMTALWAVGATLLVTKSLVMAAPLIALMFGVSIIGVMLATKSPRERLQSPLTYFGPLVTVLVFVSGVLLTAAA